MNTAYAQSRPGPDRAPLASLRTWSLALALLALAPTAISQQPASDGTVTMNMRDADIRVVAEWISQQTRRKVILDPRVNGKITVLAGEPMSLDEAYRVFVTALDVYGYSAVETGNLVRVIPNPMAKTGGGPVLDAFTSPGGQSGLVTQVIRLQQVPGTDLANMLRPLVSPAGYIAALGSNNTLVIADQAESVARLAALVKRLDASGQLQVEVIPLANASAADVARLLGAMNKRDAATPEGTGGGPAEMAVAADERTNSVLISGDDASRMQARDLVARLDQPTSGQGNTQVIPLRYQDAKELADVLKSMVGTVQKGKQDQATASAEVSIIASESNNALVVTAPPSVMDEINRVVETLDTRRRQVMVEAVIVEVNDDVARELGVQWSTSMSAEDGGEAVTNFISPASQNPMITPGAFTLGSGLTLGHYRNGSLRGLVRALTTDSTSNLLSTPSIVTLENQEAEILVGSNVPLITGQSTAEGSTTDNPFTTIERKDIGVTLKITPKINIEDAITLDVLQEVESISEDSTAATADIVTNKRSIRTRVLIRNDDVLVLGGLIRDDKSDVVRKVPLLGDIPVVGRLFQASSKVSQKRNLMVFLHPVIMDDQAIAGDITQQRYQSLRERQRELNERSEWNPADRQPPRLPRLDTQATPVSPSGDSGNKD